MRSITRFMLAACVFASANSMADSHPVEFWGCNLNEGKSMSDMMAVVGPRHHIPITCLRNSARFDDPSMTLLDASILRMGQSRIRYA